MVWDIRTTQDKVKNQPSVINVHHATLVLREAMLLLIMNYVKCMASKLRWWLVIKPQRLTFRSYSFFFFLSAKRQRCGMKKMKNKNMIVLGEQLSNLAITSWSLLADNRVLWNKEVCVSLD